MITKSERDAWTMVYRTYEEYAPELRKADADAAGEIFKLALEKMSLQWKDSSEESRLILLNGYDLLDAVWKASHKQ